MRRRTNTLGKRRMMIKKHFINATAFVWTMGHGIGGSISNFYRQNFTGLLDGLLRPTYPKMRTLPASPDFAAEAHVAKTRHLTPEKQTASKATNRSCKAWVELHRRDRRAMRRAARSRTSWFTIRQESESAAAPFGNETRPVGVNLNGHAAQRSTTSVGSRLEALKRENLEAGIRIIATRGYDPDASARRAYRGRYRSAGISTSPVASFGAGGLHRAATTYRNKRSLGDIHDRFRDFVCANGCANRAAARRTRDGTIQRYRVWTRRSLGWR